MAYAFEPDEPPAAAVRRVAHERLEKVLELLGDRDDDPDEAVHEARKQLKKQRALVRLVREALGGDVYARENEAARDAGRALSRCRDARVRVELLESLRDGEEDEPLRGALAIAADRLRAEHEDVLDDGLEAAASAAAGLVRQARERVDDWPLDDDAGFDLFRDGLKKVYARGREGLRRALADPSVEHLHEWRKRAKYLRYQVDLLGIAWPRPLSLLEELLHELTDALGDDHDVAMLRARLEDDLRDDLTDAQLAALNERLAARHRELVDAAWPLGRRLFAETPKRFADRIEAYWNA